MTNPMLDPPQIPPARLARLEEAVASLLETDHDVVLPQAEAVLALEAAARGLGQRGLTALNLDTRPYGVAIGRWLGEAGATVVGLEVEPRKSVQPEAVERALRQHPEISVLSLVHVEAATGISNDAAAIAELARGHGAMLMIDVVASFGAHEVRLRDWNAAVSVVGPQKALAGPAGISIAAVSESAWEAMSDNPGAPRGSLLSLLDWKQRWIDTDKSVIPGTPSPLEIIALEAAVERVSTEGLENVRRRHRAAAAASRTGAQALGLETFAVDAEAAVVATTLLAPEGIDARHLVERAHSVRRVALSSGFGELASTVIRIDHTGQRARLGVVLEALEVLGLALEGSAGPNASVQDALDAAERAWSLEDAAPA